LETPLTQQNSKSALPPARYVFGDECWADIDGYRMRYLRAGNGPPIVLIHGLMAHSFSWRFNLPVLAQKFTVYAVDLLGIGYSDRPPKGAFSYDLPSTADRMLRWMQKLGIHDASVLGTSHGGGLSIAMASQDQQQRSALIARLVLAAPVNPWTTVGHKRTKLFSTRLGGLMLKAIVPWLGIKRSVMLGRMYGDRKKLTQETFEGYRTPLMMPGTIDYGIAIARSWRADIAHLAVCVDHILNLPVLLIWGDRDVMVPLASGKKLNQYLKNSRLVVFPGVGHLPYEENPDEFNRILLEFLE
jgi:pimeloyl-ACP methyl ester carboxylesterase